MNDLSQGDVIKISGFKSLFLIVSNNAFIRNTGMFQVCPVHSGVKAGSVHIPVKPLRSQTETVVICEQIKLVDPKVREIGVVDRISYSDKMEVSDTLQGLIEYD